MLKTVLNKPQADYIPNLQTYLACIFVLFMTYGCKPTNYGIAPDFSLQDQSGEYFQLQSFNSSIGAGNQQGDYLFLNFWASWCVPCVTEMPLLQKTSDTSSHRLQIIGIAADRIENAQALANELKLNYPLLYAEPLTVFTLMEIYGNPQGNLPYSVLINPAGNIIWRHAGKLSEQQLADLPIE